MILAVSNYGCPSGLSINVLIFFILIESVADDNTLSAFAENVLKLINILQSESEVITDWYRNNQMIVNQSFN